MCNGNAGTDVTFYSHPAGATITKQQDMRGVELQSVFSSADTKYCVKETGRGKCWTPLKKTALDSLACLLITIFSSIQEFLPSVDWTHGSHQMNISIPQHIAPALDWLVG